MLGAAIVTSLARHGSLWRSQVNVELGMPEQAALHAVTQRRTSLKCDRRDTVLGRDGFEGGEGHDDDMVPPWRLRSIPVITAAAAVLFGRRGQRDDSGCVVNSAISTDRQPLLLDAPPC